MLALLGSLSTKCPEDSPFSLQGCALCVHLVESHTRYHALSTMAGPFSKERIGDAGRSAMRRHRMHEMESRMKTSPCKHRRRSRSLKLRGFSIIDQGRAKMNIWSSGKDIRWRRMGGNPRQICRIARPWMHLSVAIVEGGDEDGCKSLILTGMHKACT